MTKAHERSQHPYSFIDDGYITIGKLQTTDKLKILRSIPKLLQDAGKRQSNGFDELTQVSDSGK